MTAPQQEMAEAVRQAVHALRYTGTDKLFAAAVLESAYAASQERPAPASGDDESVIFKAGWDAARRPAAPEGE